MLYTTIDRCRICGNFNLVQVLDLGRQALTGVFPAADEVAEKVPVELVKCHDMPDCCGLVQLRHSVDVGMMYSDNYGYRSGLNASMLRHLDALLDYSLAFVELEPGDLAIDIGSNDGSLLGMLAERRFEAVTLLGVDPTIKKFAAHYHPAVLQLPDFFTAEKVKRFFHDPNRKAKLVTSIAMFYDLEDPQAFVDDIASILHPEGVWVFEQSYSLAMLVKNMYDTVVSEHLLYYSFKQIALLLARAGLKPIDVEINAANGGSFRVTASHAGSVRVPDSKKLELLSEQERVLGLDELSIYRGFEESAKAHKAEFVGLLRGIAERGERVAGLGASTKFNAVLQYCEIGPELLPSIGEVNEDKFGKVTPGTRIPIRPERDVLAEGPDYLVVGPYHFREFFLGLPHLRGYLSKGGKLVFPLPKLEVVGR